MPNIVTITVSGPFKSGKSSIIAIIANALGCLRPKLGPVEAEDGDLPEFEQALLNLTEVDTTVIIESETTGRMPHAGKTPNS